MRIEIKNTDWLFKYLKQNKYQFVTTTPRSHRRVLDSSAPDAATENPLRSLFGWNRWVAVEDLDPQLVTILRALEWTESSEDKKLLKCRWRFSTLNEQIFLHSGYPTVAEDSVFFGPDSYRFARFLKSEVTNAKAIVDIGAGSGVGGIFLTSHLKSLGFSGIRLALTDINPRALEIAKINSQTNQIQFCELFESDVLAKIPTGYETLISNPPFMIDSQKRAYRDGGDQLGTSLSRRIVTEASAYLKKGGALYLYTGSPIQNGQDLFKEWIVRSLPKQDWNVHYEEIDPDIFGEVLGTENYQKIERIAAVGVVIKKT